jgi:hypothetical protein
MHRTSRLCIHVVNSNTGTTHMTDLASTYFTQDEIDAFQFAYEFLDMPDFLDEITSYMSASSRRALALHMLDAMRETRDAMSCDDETPVNAPPVPDSVRALALSRDDDMSFVHLCVMPVNVDNALCVE